MNPKHLTPLAVLAAVAVVATAVTLHTGTPTIASDRRGESVLPLVLAKGNDITAVSIRDHNGNLALERRGNRFVAADSGYPVKTDAIRDLVASTATLAFEESRTDDPQRYGDLGLADPDAKDAKDSGKEISFRTATGELGDLVVGRTDTTTGGVGGGVFIRVKDEPQAFLVRGNVRLPASRAEWFVPFDLDVKRSEITKVVLSGGGRDDVTATAAAPGKPMQLDGVPENRKPEDLKIGRLGTMVEGFTFQDVRKSTDAAGDGRRMVVSRGDDLRLTFTSVGNLGDGWVRIAAEATADSANDTAKLINAKVEGWDFRLPPNLTEMLGWTATDLTTEQKDKASGG